MKIVLHRSWWWCNMCAKAVRTQTNFRRFRVRTARHQQVRRPQYELYELDAMIARKVYEKSVPRSRTTHNPTTAFPQHPGRTRARPQYGAQQPASKATGRRRSAVAMLLCALGACACMQFFVCSCCLAPSWSTNGRLRPSHGVVTARMPAMRKRKCAGMWPVGVCLGSR